ncbi:helix-turn-helix domain-containing protein [Isachenkonia alkalipeptolytica]|uniref:Helix-turn-helix domain-containing protein n=1 Tax=Isachenkonia alkalipeptolytica TaxID=2565777 RepID=A0AA44BEN7_9CLOT|nr:helix-turn-helix domain-containing protein [Isachenkonia alkalipeptolytica]NBG87731.1 helix-turn-helix domain-containing protein [Isachenkonia alkalipeptolytica]
MDFDSVLKGLDEAIKISNGEIKGRRRKVSISPAQEFSKDEIKRIRQYLQLTQVTFAEVIGVTPKTVEAWERGTNAPTGPARRMMTILKEDPESLNRYHIISK